MDVIYTCKWCNRQTIFKHPAEWRDAFNYWFIDFGIDGKEEILIGRKNCFTKTTLLSGRYLCSKCAKLCQDRHLSTTK